MPDRDPLTLMAEAVEARLRLFFQPARWTFELVPDALTTDEFRTILGMTPLLALSFRDINQVPAIGRNFSANLGMRLTIVVKNQRGRSWRFLGDDRGPGLFPAIAAALAVLNGHTVQELGTIFATAGAQAYADGFSDLNAAIATIDLMMLVKLGDMTGDLADAPDFLRLLNSFDSGPDGLLDPELQTVRP